MAARLAEVPGGVVRAAKTPCRSFTFNVFYGSRREACYEGTGGISVNLPNVVRSWAARP